MVSRKQAVSQLRSVVTSAAALAIGAIPAGSILESAHAVSGLIQLDSQAFLKDAQDRGNTATQIKAGPQLSSEGSRIAGKFDGYAIGFLTDPSSFTFEARDAYLSTSRELMPHHQVTVGRRFYKWSQIEDSWSLVGLSTPRFTWDPLRPQQIGLTGVFYTYDSKSWHLQVFASPIDIPERGYPMKVKDGKIVSASPDMPHAFGGMSMMDKVVGMRYAIVYPSIDKLLLNPGAEASLAYGQERGFWARINYGVMPIHQPDITVESKLDAQNDVLNAQVHPRILHHHMVAAESGYRTREWSLWASVTGESPIKKSTDPNLITNRMGPAAIFGVGWDLRWENGFMVEASALSIQEAKPALKADDVDIGMGDRFPLTNALRASARYGGDSKLSYNFSWTHDLTQASSLFSLDLMIRASAVPNTGISFGLGSDFFATTTGRGMFGQYEGNDRIRGRIAYAF